MCFLFALKTASNQTSGQIFLQLLVAEKSRCKSDSLHSKSFHSRTSTFMAGSQAAKWEETQVKRCLNWLYPFAGVTGLYLHRGAAGQGFLRLWIPSAQENREATGETHWRSMNKYPVPLLHSSWGCQSQDIHLRALRPLNADYSDTALSLSVSTSPSRDCNTNSCPRAAGKLFPR